MNKKCIQLLWIAVALNVSKPFRFIESINPSPVKNWIL